MEYKYKAGWRRFFAHYIDGILLYPLNKLLVIILTSELPFVFKEFSFTILSCIGPMYFVLCHGNFGATLGKRILNIKVLDVSETKLSWKQAFLRESPILLLMLISIPYELVHFDEMVTLFKGVQSQTLTGFNSFPTWMKLLLGSSFLWALIEWLTMLTNNKRRAIHDFLAGSIVIKTQEKQGPSRKLRMLGYTLIALGTFLLSLIFWLYKYGPVFEYIKNNWPYTDTSIFYDPAYNLYLGKCFFWGLITTIIGIVIVKKNKAPKKTDPLEIKPE